MSNYKPLKWLLTSIKGGIKPNKYFLNFVFLSALFMFCSQNLHAQNKEWNIYKNFDYWKYPTIAITRNTSLEGHRVRTEITCSGTYLSAKLIYSYPSDWKNIDIRKKLILEKTPFNFVGGGTYTEQHPKHYSVFSIIFRNHPSIICSSHSSPRYSISSIIQT